MSDFCKKCKKLNQEYEEMQEGSRINYLNGVGPLTAPLLLVGEAPGAEEAAKKENFVGLSGRYLQKQILHLAGLSKTSLRVENAVRCRPKANRVPKEGEIRNCREYLVEVIKKQKPKGIIATGGVAWTSLTNFSLAHITAWQGKKVWSNEFNCWIMPILHPAALLRTRSQFDVFNTVSYLEALKEAVKQPAPKISIPKLKWVKTEKQHDLLLDQLYDSEEFVIDIETTGSKSKGEFSNFMKHDIIGVAFSTKRGEGFFVSFEMVERMKAQYKELFDSDRLKIMHNSSFDVKFLAKKGLVVRGNVFDTMLAHHLIDENFEGEHNLKSLAWRYTLYGGYDTALEEYKRAKKVKDYADIPLDVLAPYACYDALVTYELKQLFNEKLKEEKTDKLFWDIVMPARKVLTKMEYDGMLVDVDQLQKIQTKLLNDLEMLTTEVVKVAESEGMENFNPSSSKQIQVLLFNKLKLKSVKKTKTGESTDIEVLNALVGKHKVVDLMVDYRKLEKYKSTYIDGVLSRLDANSKVHTSYLSHGTVTGRLSSRGPNLQNITRDKDVKTVYMASSGYSLIDADYSQAELRGVAHYSQDPFMVQAFKEDKDIHTMTAVEFYGVGEEEITKEQRVFIKTINFGIVYGRGAKSLAEAMGISIIEAESYLKKYFVKFRGIKKFVDATIAKARRDGYIVNMFGRKRRLPEVNHNDSYLRAEAERQAVNSLIQGTIADITQTALVRIDNAFRKYKIRGHLLLQVHDSIVSEVLSKDAETAVKITKEQMELPIPGFTVPIRADVEICKRWGEHNDSLGYVWRDVKKEILKKGRC